MCRYVYAYPVCVHKHVVVILPHTLTLPYKHSFIGFLSQSRPFISFQIDLMQAER